MTTLRLPLPFTGWWSVQNSPARRVPSHGVDVYAQRYAIDFVGVDDRGRDSAVRDWRTVLATEPPTRFVAFGRPVLAPVQGVVVRAHDGEPDHTARRSWFALVPYALGQASRVRQGVAAIAGNHVVVQDTRSGLFVAMVHLRRGSVRVGVDDTVTLGRQVAECGSSGNSTQPHLHLQVMDSDDLRVARGVPVEFTDYELRDAPGSAPRAVAVGVPAERALVRGTLRGPPPT